METREHLGSDCPGRAYFEKKAKKDEETMRKVFSEKVGDVPKYMKIAGENRIWLLALSVLFVLSGMILIMI